MIDMFLDRFRCGKNRATYLPKATSTDDLLSIKVVFAQ